MSKWKSNIEIYEKFLNHKNEIRDKNEILPVYNQQIRNNNYQDIFEIEKKMNIFYFLK